MTRWGGDVILLECEPASSRAGLPRAGHRRRADGYPYAPADGARPPRGRAPPPGASPGTHRSAVPELPQLLAPTIQRSALAPAPLQTAFRQEVGRAVRPLRQVPRVPAYRGRRPGGRRRATRLRAAVLWRKGSFGHQSEVGAQFVERILTVVATLRLHRRQVWDYLIRTCEAAAHGQPAPSLIHPGG